MSGWQPISTAPKDREILLWFPAKKRPRPTSTRGYIFKAIWYLDEDGDGPESWYDPDTFERVGDDPTMWHEMPEPPTDEGG